MAIRTVVEALGGTVGWDGGERKVTVKKDDTAIEIWLDKKTIRVNGTEKTIDVAPTTINNRTMVPERFVTENLPGCNIEWDGDTKSVIITK